MGAAGQCLGGGGLAPDRVALDVGILPRPLGDHALQDASECLGDLRRYDVFFYIVFQLFYICTVRALDAHPEMGRDPIAAVYEGTDRCGQLDRRDLERLTK